MTGTLELRRAFLSLVVLLSILCGVAAPALAVAHGERSGTAALLEQTPDEQRDLVSRHAGVTHPVSSPGPASLAAPARRPLTVLRPLAPAETERRPHLELLGILRV